MSVWFYNIDNSLQTSILCTSPCDCKNIDRRVVTARTLESIIITPNKLFIGRDFNIHVNDESDVIAKAFLYLLQNYYLMNHVWQPTHVAGNTLDLTITRNNNEISFDSPLMRSFISGHCFVKVLSTIEKPEV